jgi:hypothetical protein
MEGPCPAHSRPYDRHVQSVCFPRLTAFTGLILTGLIHTGLISHSFNSFANVCQVVASHPREVCIERQKPYEPPELMRRSFVGIRVQQ